ncbi:MAG: ribonuclease HI family protein [Candidatus Saganbacteria bacterium]|nr:ribonuclease HI family protein [Candidatus Saganbacteria bacterium]
MLTVNIDGASRGNPGESGIGIVIKKSGRVIKKISEYIGNTTNNVAEYTALVRGLEEVLLLGHKEAEFISDSELVVRQMNGAYRVKDEDLKLLFNHAKVLIAKFKHFSIKHVLRDLNLEADALANNGIDSK